MYHYTHEDLELLYLMSDGMDGEDADPGAAQELRDLEAAGHICPGQCCNSTYSSSKAAAQTHN